MHDFNSYMTGIYTAYESNNVLKISYMQILKRSRSREIGRGVQKVKMRFQSAGGNLESLKICQRPL
jgi:hypothetical protein